jgi:hypothetical protein
MVMEKLNVDESCGKAVKMELKQATGLSVRGK